MSRIWHCPNSVFRFFSVFISLGYSVDFFFSLPHLFGLFGARLYSSSRSSLLYIVHTQGFAVSFALLALPRVRVSASLLFFSFPHSAGSSLCSSPHLTLLSSSLLSLLLAFTLCSLSSFLVMLRYVIAIVSIRLIRLTALALFSLLSTRNYHGSTV